MHVQKYAKDDSTHCSEQRRESTCTKSVVLPLEWMQPVDTLQVRPIFPSIFHFDVCGGVVVLFVFK